MNSNNLKYIFPVRTVSNLINFSSNDPAVNRVDELNSKEEDISSRAIIRSIYIQEFESQLYQPNILVNVLSFDHQRVFPIDVRFFFEYFLKIYILMNDSLKNTAHVFNTPNKLIEKVLFSVTSAITRFKMCA